MLWVLVILADFILEFRFEFLWPFYLLLRSVYDSFKYQGIAFSIFFVCIALTSDMLCFFFIPVHWLFFAASTYVWVQYVWHTDKGICAPTIMMWMLFVYLEAAVRLRDVKHMPGHLDLCRPFAAHCIGYPVVTLGFGFKSYIGYRMRQRKQRDVAKENEFYLQLMQQALPVDVTNTLTTQSNDTSSNSSSSNNNNNNSNVTAVIPTSTANTTTTSSSSSSSTTVTASSTQQNVQNNKINRQSHEKNGHLPNGTLPNGTVHQKPHRKSLDKCKEHDEHRHEKHDKHIEKQKINHSHSNGSAVGVLLEETQPDPEPRTQRRREKKEQDKERETAEYLQKMEMETKRLRNDLQSSRASEQELRLQVSVNELTLSNFFFKYYYKFENSYNPLAFL